MTRKTILAEIQMSEESVNFEIAEPGSYSVWVKAPVFQKNYLDKIKVKIYNQDDKEYVKLQYTIFGTQSNNGSVGQMKFLTFKAKAGHYKIELVEGSNLPFWQKHLGAVLPLKYADINNCLFQIRKN